MNGKEGNLSRPDGCKSDKVTVPEYMPAFINNKDLPEYQFLWGKRDIHLDVWIDLMWSLRPPEADWTIVSPHFSTCILNGMMQDYFSNGHMYPLPWIAVETVYFLVNEPKQHWCLAQFEIRTGVVTFYDSLGCDGRSRRRWWRRMKKVLPKKLTLYLLMHGIFDSKGISADHYKITYNYASVPFQASLYGDCGIWVRTFIYRLCRNLPVAVDNDPLETAYNQALPSYEISLDHNLTYSPLVTVVNDSNLLPVGTCHGIWCFSYGIPSICCSLWNPSIKRSINILVPAFNSQPKSDKILLGFGVRPDTLDPTIIKVSYPRGGHGNWYVSVFTLSSMDWKKLDNDCLPRESIRFKRSSQVVVGRLLFWAGHERFVSDDGHVVFKKHLLVSFDLIGHSFQVHDIDAIFRDGLTVPMCLSSIGNSLILSGSTDETDCYLFCGWSVLVDVTSLTSFTLLFAIPTPNYVKLLGFTMDEISLPIVEVPGPHQLANSVQVLNISTQTLQNLGIQGVAGSFFIGQYKESLILLPYPDRELYHMLRLLELWFIKCLMNVVDAINISLFKFLNYVFLVSNLLNFMFWITAKVKTINGECQIQAIVDKKKAIITEKSIMSDLKLDDAEVISSHTKKVFANMKREGKGFSGRVTPLFQSMMVQASEDMGEDSAAPTDSHSTPIITQPSSSKPKKKKSRRKQRKDSGPTKLITETTHQEHVSTPSYDPPQSGEDRMQLHELMNLCTKLSDRVLALENANTSQAAEIAKLKERIKKLEKKRRSRIYKSKRLYKVGSSRRVESSEESLGAQEDAFNQRRKIIVIDQDTEVTLVNEAEERNDEEMLFDVDDDLQGEEVVIEEVAKKEISTADLVTTAGEVVTTTSIEVTTASAPTTTIDELTMAQTLIEINAAKPKAVTTNATTVTIGLSQKELLLKSQVRQQQQKQ
ncbi:F-box domain containing protein [Tanacetum coccineum]